ncbi:MAG: YeeE/YedE family protein [Actinobacteria bacterium]|uniref:Unannotated protein n=1 Tax=freshwater metagenome TaxID=449393 RepID=A0A6J6E9H7_9ZZZZ|nr:YeeE/YedE family protein [Actinomycetota bacterium]
MTTTVPQPQSTGAIRSNLPSVQTSVIVAGVAASALLLWGIAASQGSAKSVLFLLGLALGVTLFHSRFGFTSAWRQLVSVGQGRALQAHTVMLALAVVFFAIIFEIGSGWFGTTPDGFYAPITLALFVGAALFGIGMQLGGSCASGTLFATGSGNLAVVITLVGFITGSGLGVAGFDFWTTGSGFQKIADPVSLRTEFGLWGGVAVSLAIIATIAVVAELIIRRRRPPAIEAVPSTVGVARILRGSWPLWAGAIVLAVLNALVLLTTGRPWGVTSAFRLWASKIMNGVGLDVGTWSFWNERPGLDASLLADNTSVANFGIILGALVASAAAGAFSFYKKVPGRTVAAGLIGGVLMGYGATFASGCNIGAYFSGIASGSLHGYLWAVAALVGTYIGLKLRPLFALPVPKPTDSSC